MACHDSSFHVAISANDDDDDATLAAQSNSCRTHRDARDDLDELPSVQLAPATIQPSDASRFHVQADQHNRSNKERAQASPGSQIAICARRAAVPLHCTPSPASLRVRYADTLRLECGMSSSLESRGVVCFRRSTVRGDYVVAAREQSERRRRRREKKVRLTDYC